MTKKYYSIGIGEDGGTDHALYGATTVIPLIDGDG